MDNDWYEILGVPRHAEPDEIKAAYRALALQRHPDLNAGDPGAGALFMRIQAAYEVLSNPYRRALYDRAQASPVRDAGPPPRTAPRRGSGTSLLMIFGVFLALNGFIGIFFVPPWPLPVIGREESLRLYLVGTAAAFFAFGLRRLRRD